MALKAPPELQAQGSSIEIEAFHKIGRALADRGSALIVNKGSDDSRENGEGGDVLIRRNSWEAPFLSVEVKAPTHPRSFTLSDYEKRCSEAHFVYVKGTLGVWCVYMDDVRDSLFEKGDSASDRYWVTERSVYGKRISFDQMMDQIQILGGEVPKSSYSSLGLLGTALNNKKP